MTNPTTYWQERTLADERGCDDARKGKPMDERMRAYSRHCTGWNYALWSVYLDAYNRTLDEMVPFALEA